MKRWFIALALVVAGSANAWTAEGYNQAMRSTIAEMDAHYTEEMKKVYSSQELQTKEKKANAASIQAKWTAHREQVIRDMRQVATELKAYEERQLNSSIRIRAKLQQTLGEIQQWRNAELGRIQTLPLSGEEKARKRLEINQAADARSKQITISATTHEAALRKLNDRADRPMFSVKQETSSFALNHIK